jgi:hypothetical protein
MKQQKNEIEKYEEKIKAANLALISLRKDLQIVSTPFIKASIKNEIKQKEFGLAQNKAKLAAAGPGKPLVSTHPPQERNQPARGQPIIIRKRSSA